MTRIGTFKAEYRDTIDRIREDFPENIGPTTISNDIVLYLQIACKQKAMDTEDANIGYAFVGLFVGGILGLIGYVVYATKCHRRDPLDYELIPTVVVT